jgi:hypothetical protein
MLNLNVENGICNGTIMVVEKFSRDVAWCRVQSRYGEILYPFGASHFKYKSGILEFTRTQLPLRIAFAATINRAQGGTYDKVGFDTRHPVWSPGQTYTVVTRVTSAEGFTALCDPRRDYTHNGVVLPTMRNVVHPWVSGLDQQQRPPPATGGGPSDQPPSSAPGPGPTVQTDDDLYEGPEFNFHDSTQTYSAQQSTNIPPPAANMSLMPTPSAPTPSWSSVSGSAGVEERERGPRFVLNSDLSGIDLLPFAYL